MSYVPTLEATRFADSFFGEIDAHALALAFDAGVKDALTSLAGMLSDEENGSALLTERGAGVLPDFLRHKASMILEQDNTKVAFSGED